MALDENRPARPVLGGIPWRRLHRVEASTGTSQSSRQKGVETITRGHVVVRVNEGIAEERLD